MIFSLSTELHDRLYQALLHCEEFNINMRLAGELATYNSRVFDYPYNAKDEKGKKEELAERAIKYLVRQRIKRKHLVLPLFLMVLYDTLGEDDELRYELEELHTLVVSELDEIVKSQTALKTAPDMKQTADPSPLFPAINPINNIFLVRDDRQEIENILTNLLDTKGLNNVGKRRLLRDCELPDAIIKAIHFHEASGNVAEEIVGFAATWDQPHPTLKYLENFVLNLVREAGYTGNKIETEMKDIIARYNQKRNLYASNAQSHKGYIRLKPEEYAIDKQFQEARDTNSRTPFQVSPKLDIHRIIQCNLDPQRTSFITGFNGSYNGFFTFAVASVEYSVLMNYVLKSLLWELEKRTNSRATVHSISLYLEDLNLSDVERGTISLQKRISQFFRGKSLRDVLEDTQEANLAIIFSWNKNVMPPHFKDIVRLFSETIKQQVGDILQNRYLILFWAHYGSAPIEPLDVSVTLPTFERFKVEHVIGWLDNSLRSQLKAQNIPEQDIKLWRESLVEKIKDHDGRLPGTYEVLLESLERGGAF